MSVSLAKKVIIILFALSLLSCGELETLLPSKGSYQVKTMVNGNSLENCSIIHSTDEIRPYFAVSVEDDPDLVGLMMYFQNSRGEIVGEKVRYILEAYADELAQEEITVPQEAEPQKTDQETDNETLNELIDLPPAETAEEEIEKIETNEPTEPAEELPKAKRRRSFNNTKIRENSIAIEIAVSSLTGELPEFPLPENTEPNSYTLVFEALGKKEVLSRTETSVFYLGSAEFNLKDVTMYLPWLSDLQLIAPETTVLLETRLDFDSRLDPYVIWYNGKNIISEGKLKDGTGNLLWKAPAQAAPYSLRIEVFPFQPKRNVAGVSREVTLPVSVSPKAANMGYFFENAINYTARSPLTEGTIYPEQVQLIAAMALAESADDDDDEETVAPVPPSPPELLRWYQFDGSLHDSKAPLVDEQSLASINEKAPRWASAKQSYGLSTEVDDAYQISPINFFLKEQDQGGGIFLFHIKPSTEGVIFNTFFPMLASENDGAWMGMIRQENTIVLRLNAGNTTAEIPVYVDSFRAQGFIPIVVEFYISPYLLEAKISLGENMPSNAGKVSLPAALKGEGRIRLGGEDNTATLATTQTSVKFRSPETASNSPVEETDTDTDIVETQPQTVHHPNTIWDEFAILFSSLPLLQEEFFEETIIETEEIKSESNTSEAYQHKTEQKVTTSLTDDDTETVGGEDTESPELDINDSIQERETDVIIPENN